MTTPGLTPLDRRLWIKRLALAAGAMALPRFARAAEGADAAPRPTAEQLAAIRKLTEKVMADQGLPGLSVVVTRMGKLAYQNAAGFADPAKREPLTAAHRFRIASISKPITAVAILALSEQGRLKLSDRVFGKSGLLGADFPAAPEGNVGKIEVRHLLNHTCGGWGNSRNDPMFSKPDLDQRKLIEWTLREIPVEHEPGTRHDYSNFGYCVLGRVIAKVSGRPYAEAVNRMILAKCGIKGMRIAGDTRAERAPDEVAYVDADADAPYRMKVARMDAHGGWIGSPEDLVRFALHVDGFAAPPDILRPETLRVMTTPGPASPNYACGWAVNRAPNWWHNGSLPGTTTLLVRTASGLCWAAFANARSKDSAGALDRFMWDLVRTVPAWNA